MKRTIKKPKLSKDKDIQQIQVALAALKGTQHNPINWAPIVTFIAPFVGRLAARYAAGILASYWNKRATPKIRKEVAEQVADRLSIILQSALK